MGQIIIHGMQELKHANGGTDPITVSVFAWAEEVSLAVPTSVEPATLSPQSGSGDDEYGNGPVSKPAGTIAKVAGALENVPGISPFAKATQLAASAVSNVATMFGYSRPIELGPIQSYKPTYLGVMANTNVPDTSTKLTLDAKQEITIDPRAMGLGSQDEMTIKSIATRESWLTSFGWATSAGAEDLLFSTDVSPVLWNQRGDPLELHFPACCFAALPFEHWRGNIKFRFQVVCSAYHKGRLRISYDPVFHEADEYNTNYTHIIDIAKEKDFVIEIGWGQGISMARHKDPGVDPLPWRTTPILTSPGDRGNGVLSVYVVNDLTSPNSTVNNDVTINVFVSAGDNFEVYNPTSENIKDYTYFTPQGGKRGVSLKDIEFVPQSGESSHPDADETKSENEPLKMMASENVASFTTPTDHTIDVYFGDPVVSFRQALKRYEKYRLWTYQQSAANRDAGGLNVVGAFESLPNFPLYRGYAPGAIDFTSTPSPFTLYNFVEMTLLNYVTPAFTCRRGGLRHKYIRIGGSTDDVWYATRHEGSVTVPGSPNFATAVSTVQPRSTQTRQFLTALPHTWDGSHATHPTNNPVLEVEIPFYTNYRFHPAKYAGNLNSIMFAQGATHDVGGTWTYPATDRMAGMADFVSVGEDFQLGFFTGCPVIYRVAKDNSPPSQ
jgi:hypothetical protein